MNGTTDIAVKFKSGSTVLPQEQVPFGSFPIDPTIRMAACDLVFFLLIKKVEAGGRHNDATRKGPFVERGS